MRDQVPSRRLRSGKGITDASIQDYRVERLGAKKRPAVSTLNTELTVLRHILHFAVRRKVRGSVPIVSTKKKGERKRNRFATPDEIARLLAACEPGSVKAPKQVAPLLAGYLKPFVLVALNTGMRRTEILNLRRADIDWQNRSARLEQQKNGDEGQVRLNQTAIAALRSIPARLDTDQLFPFSGQAVTDAFRRAVKRAKIVDFRLHDLRHTFASYQAMQGAPLKAIGGLLRHRDGRSTERYTHLTDEYLNGFVDTLNLGQNAPQDGSLMAVDEGRSS